MSARIRPRGRRVGALALALGLLLVVLGAGPAAAHASLVSVDPPDGARLDEAPASVTLTFSEPVSVDLGGVRVLDSDGDPVEDGTARADGRVVTLALQPDLPDGTYVITYRVVSADGHPVRGGSVFGVGTGPVDTGALGRVSDQSGDRLWEVVGGFGRGLAYAGALTAAGGALFLAFVLRRSRDDDPAVEAADEADRTWLMRLVQVAALVGALASLVAFPVQAALGTGQGPGSLFDEGVLADVAQDGVGHSLLLVLVGLALLAVGVRRSVPATVVGALVAAGSFAATGHTRAGDSALLATLADIAHLLAAAVWGGGLLLLWLTVRRRRARSADPGGTGELVARFSALATVAILVVGAAGLALGWSEVRALHALTDTSYGLFLLAKVAVVGAIATMGAYNHFRVVPAFRTGRTKAALAQLGHTLRIEVVGLVGVLALTSVLVVLTPARASVEGTGVVERIVDVGDAGSVQVVVSPARAGFNQIHLYTYDPTGRPVDIGEGVTLELSLPSADLGPIDRDATRAGPAHFQLDGSDLAVAGTWELTIRVRVDRFTEATGTAQIPVAS